MKKIIFIIVLTTLMTICYAKLNFYKEQITFYLEENVFKVKALYFFSNSTKKDISRTLIYPFPVDDTLYGRIDSVTAINLDSSRGALIAYSPQKASIRIDIAAQTTACLKISYQQELLSNKAKYILTTTRFWQNPLNEAKYVLHTSSNLQIENFSYQPDISKKNYYVWKKVNFLPENDFEIEFSINNN